MRLRARFRLPRPKVSTAWTDGPVVNLPLVYWAAWLPWVMGTAETSSRRRSAGL